MKPAFPPALKQMRIRYVAQTDLQKKHDLTDSLQLQRHNNPGTESKWNRLAIAGLLHSH